TGDIAGQRRGEMVIRSESYCFRTVFLSADAPAAARNRGGDRMDQASQRHNQNTRSRFFVVDAHCDTALRLADGETLTPPGHPSGHIDLPRLRAGGVGLQVFALWVDADRRETGRLLRCLELLDAVKREVARLSDDMH